MNTETNMTAFNAELAADEARYQAVYVTLDITPGAKHYASHTGTRVKVLERKAFGVVTVELYGAEREHVDFPNSQYKDLSHDAFLEFEKEALEATRNGADIYDYAQARALRYIEFKAPELLDIVPAMNAPKNGAKRQPYFGCIATTKGRIYLKSAGRKHGVR